LQTPAAERKKATGFIPLAGELIIYDKDENYDYERIKIGDGVRNVEELPFYSTSWNDLSDKPFGETGEFEYYPIVENSPAMM
jgi:hypothetical protein